MKLNLKNYVDSTKSQQFLALKLQNSWPKMLLEKEVLILALC